MKKKGDTNVVSHGFRHYYSLSGHISGIDFGSEASYYGLLNRIPPQGLSLFFKASTINPFKRAKERLAA